MAARIYGDQYGTRRKDWRRKFFSLGSKSTYRATSTQLRRPVVLSMRQHCPVNVSFKSDDKLIIIFAYQKKFVVYKKSNSTVAVLENVLFKQKNPPTMFNGANLGALLYKMELKLMYAVAKKAYSEPKGILFNRNDVVLILAHCREIFLGITEDQRVGFFPAETVNIITNPKSCFFEGMTLTVTGVVNFLGEDQMELSVYEKQHYEITKGRCGLFDWFALNHLQVPLHAISESGMTSNDDAISWVEGNNRAGKIQPKPDPVQTSADDFVSMASGDRRDLGEVYVVYDEYPLKPMGQGMNSSEDNNPPQIEEDDGNEYEDLDEYQPLKIGHNVPLPPRPPSTYIQSCQQAQEADDFVDDYNDLDEYLKMKTGILPKREERSDDFAETYDHLPPLPLKYENINCDCERGVASHDPHEDNHTPVGKCAERVKSMYILSDEAEDRPHSHQRQVGKKVTTMRIYPPRPQLSSNPPPLPPRHPIIQDDRNFYENSGGSCDGDEAEENSNLSDEGSDDEQYLYHYPDGSENMEKPTADHSPVPAPRRQLLEQKKINEREAILQKLLPYREVVINDELRDIVAESVDPDVLYDLCKQIKVSKNRLEDIHDQKETIYEKTYDLLGIWQRKFGSNANVGVLLDALIEVNPVDLQIILEDMLRHFEDAYVRDSDLYANPDEDMMYTVPKKARDKKVKDFLNDLRCFHEVGFNDEMRHIVSLYIDEDVWHELGKCLEIPKNTRIEIEKNNDGITGKTFDLLGQWHQKFGSQATLGFLLEALVSSNPEDLYLILKDLSKDLDTSLYEDVQ